MRELGSQTVLIVIYNSLMDLSESSALNYQIKLVYVYTFIPSILYPTHRVALSYLDNGCQLIDIAL